MPTILAQASFAPRCFSELIPPSSVFSDESNHTILRREEADAKAIDRGSLRKYAPVCSRSDPRPDPGKRKELSRNDCHPAVCGSGNERLQPEPEPVPASARARSDRAEPAGVHCSRRRAWRPCGLAGQHLRGLDPRRPRRCGPVALGPSLRWAAEQRRQYQGHPALQIRGPAR